MDAPCSSSRVMDPSCLFTTDEGESETKIRRTEQLKQQQSQYKHLSADVNPQETHCNTGRVKNLSTTNSKATNSVKMSLGGLKN